MPYQEVMPKFAEGRLHSGSKGGPIVKSRKQAIAIKLSEQHSGKREYHSLGENIAKRRKSR